MISRIGLLLSITWVMRLTAPLFTVASLEISGRDLILVGGGLFLLAKSTLEIHENLEGVHGSANKRVAASFMGVIMQIMVLDLVFSLDSVITAIGLAEHIPIMILAIVIAVAVMMVSAGPLSRFIEHHPTLKILALSFLLLIGVTLIGEGLNFHVPKGYIYFAMAFSVFVEMLNMRLRRSDPITLRRPLDGSGEASAQDG
jgi:predicted tellurium resistance membrane protein TerC